MANKHEINGYIYVTSEEKSIYGDYVSNGKHFCIYEKESLILIRHWHKIILCNNPNLPIQQLTEQEVEYLKGVDSFEVEKNEHNLAIGGKLKNYKILIPQETEKERGITIINVSEQPKESIEEKEAYKYFLKGYNHAKQTLYSVEDIENYVDDVIGGFNGRFPEWFNKHKK